MNDNSKAVEIVGYGFELSATDTRKDFEYHTKPEHRRILGVFLATEDDLSLDKCYVQLSIDNKNIVSYNEVQGSILQKTKYLSVEDSRWETDIAVDDSRIRLTVENKAAENIKGNLYLIAERNA